MHPFSTSAYIHEALSIFNLLGSSIPIVTESHWIHWFVVVPCLIVWKNSHCLVLLSWAVKDTCLQDGRWWTLGGATATGVPADAKRNCLMGRWVLSLRSSSVCCVPENAFILFCFLIFLPIDSIPHIRLPFKHSLEACQIGCCVLVYLSCFFSSFSKTSTMSQCRVRVTILSTHGDLTDIT